MEQILSLIKGAQVVAESYVIYVLCVVAVLPYLYAFITKTRYFRRSKKDEAELKSLYKEYTSRFSFNFDEENSHNAEAQVVFTDSQTLHQSEIKSSSL